MFFLFIALIIGIIPAIIASNKGYNGCAWYIYGVLLFIVALPHALLLKPNEQAPGMSKCPYCKEIIKKEALVCKYCGKSLTHEGQNELEVANRKETAVALKQKECPKCKILMNADAIFCPSCGWKFEEIVCPKCNSIYTQQINFCSKCGYNFTPLGCIDKLLDKEKPDTQVDQPVKEEGKKRYTLIVTAPEDRKNRYFFTKMLAEKTGKGFEQISATIDKGIVLNYSDKDKMIRNKEIYEGFSCIVEIKEENIEQE